MVHLGFGDGVGLFRHVQSERRRRRMPERLAMSAVLSNVFEQRGLRWTRVRGWSVPVRSKWDPERNLPIDLRHTNHHCRSSALRRPRGRGSILRGVVQLRAATGSNGVSDGVRTLAADVGLSSRCFYKSSDDLNPLLKLFSAPAVQLSP